MDVGASTASYMSSLPAVGYSVLEAAQNAQVDAVEKLLAFNAENQASTSQMEFIGTLVDLYV